MSQRAAWIGLGVMGYPMAGHLKSKAGIAVTVYNRTAEKAAQMGRRNSRTRARRHRPRRRRMRISSSPASAMTMTCAR